MNVRELRKHLKKMDPELEIWVCDELEQFARIDENSVRQYTLSDEDGENPFEVCVIGEAP